MMDQAIHRCIDAWRNDARCTEVLTLGRLPPQQRSTDQDTAAPPADQQRQPAPSTSDTGGTPAPGATGGAPSHLHLARISPDNQQKRSQPGML